MTKENIRNVAAITKYAIHLEDSATGINTDNYIGRASSAEVIAAVIKHDAAMTLFRWVRGLIEGKEIT